MGFINNIMEKEWMAAKWKMDKWLPTMKIYEIPTQFLNFNFFNSIKNPSSGS